MAKHKVTVTIDPAVLALADADAGAARQNRSEYVERVLRDEHYRRMMAAALPQPAATAAQTRQARALMDWARTDAADLPFVSGAEA